MNPEFVKLVKEACEKIASKPEQVSWNALKALQNIAKHNKL